MGAADSLVLCNNEGVIATSGAALATIMKAFTNPRQFQSLHLYGSFCPLPGLGWMVLLLPLGNP